MGKNQSRKTSLLNEINHRPKMYAFLGIEEAE